MATTSGTTLFDLSFNELAEEAWERAGREMRSGYDLRTARRSFNLMSLEWQNRGINMWSIVQDSITLVPGLHSYALPTDPIDVMDHVIRTDANQEFNQSDLTISRISMPTYATIPNKLTQARPIQVMVQRMSGEVQKTTVTTASAVAIDDTTIEVSSTVGMAAEGFINIDNETIYYNYIVGNELQNCFRGQNNTTAATHLTATPLYVNWLPTVTFWPTPDNTQTYTFVYWRMRRIQDSTGAYVNDINPRFLPAAVAGLAYYIAMKQPDTTPMGLQRVAALKMAYDEQYDLAAQEDREKAPIRFVPRRQFIGSR